MNPRDVFGRRDVPLLTAREAAEVDRAAREQANVPERVLMENAGRSAALVLDRLFPRGRVAAAVGSGNNGGDAMVLLRTLRAWGRDVVAVQAGGRLPPAELRHGFDLPVVEGNAAAREFTAADVLVDGILGTGAEGAPRGAAATAIDAMNRSGRPILALDLPSGVDATHGGVPGAAVDAAVTVTFGWPKQGLLLHPARSRCGRLIAVEIAFPPMAPGVARAALLTPGWAAAHLPQRDPSAHKHSTGHLLIVAGSRGMAGAALMTGRSAMRAGAGYVHVVSADENRHILQAAAPELLFASRQDADALDRLGGAADALLVGPGLGRDEDAARALDAALASTGSIPLLLDADALWLVAERGGEGMGGIAAGRPVVVTPHAGEMARLVGISAEQVRANSIEIARAYAEASGCVVLLKGTPSVIAAPGEEVFVNTVGSSDLATAGMGDQLAGAIAAFLAAGVAPGVAAGLGLFFSGRAADLCGMGRSLLPADVAEKLPAAFADPGPTEPPLGLPFILFDQPPRW